MKTIHVQGESKEEFVPLFVGTDSQGEPMTVAEKAKAEFLGDSYEPDTI